MRPAYLLFAVRPARPAQVWLRWLPSALRYRWPDGRGRLPAFVGAFVKVVSFVTVGVLLIWYAIRVFWTG